MLLKFSAHQITMLATQSVNKFILCIDYSLTENMN